MKQSSSPQNRRSTRSNVLLAATLNVGGDDVPVRLRNLSAQGALVEADAAPALGTEVVFRRNELVVAGRVAWVHGRHAGIAFADELQPQDVLRNVPSPAPKLPINFKRPGFGRPLSEQEQRLVESWF